MTIRAELPPFAAVFPILTADIYSVTLDMGHATVLTLAWDTSGSDSRVLSSERSPLGEVVTVYEDAVQASEGLGAPPFELLADAIEFERAIRRAGRRGRRRSARAA